MDPRGEYLDNYRCVDRCQKVNTSTKALYVTQLSDALTIHFNIFKYIDSFGKTFIPNLSIDEEISLWDNRVVLLVLFIMRENRLIAGIVQHDSTWIVHVNFSFN